MLFRGSKIHYFSFKRNTQGRRLSNVKKRLSNVEKRLSNANVLKRLDYTIETSVPENVAPSSIAEWPVASRILRIVPSALSFSLSPPLPPTRGISF
jgi:hypothetical protein